MTQIKTHYINMVLVCVQLILTDISGTTLTLSGSANYAVLGQTFRFSCSLTDDTEGGVFLSFGKLGQASSCGVIVSTSSSNPCTQAGTGRDYTCGCVSGQTGVYYMDITSVSVTQDEGTWRCQRLSTFSNNITLPVYYVPQLKFSYPSIRFVTEFSHLQIDCSSYSTPGKPTTTIYTWTYGGSTVSSGAVLDINNINRDRRGQYTCTASNTAGSSNANVTVDVQYGPQIKSTFPASRTVTEFSRLQIDCSIYTTPSNPPTTIYTWTYEGTSISSGAVLDINNIGRDRRGQYTCTSSNTAGSSNASVTVDVQYLDRPSITFNKTEVVENETVSLACTVDSNPPAELEIRNVDTDTVLVQRDTNRLEFTIDRVQCLHNGSYLCTARNSRIGDVSTSPRQKLNVLCKPSLSNKQSSSRVTNHALGDIAPLTVHVVANPSPRFDWYIKNNKLLLPIPNSTEHTIVSSQQASVLQIHLNSTSEYGTYAVVVMNGIGQLTMTFTVSPLSQENGPQTPDRFGLGVGVGISILIPVIIIIIIISVLLRRRQERPSKNTESGQNELRLSHINVSEEQRTYDDVTNEQPLSQSTAAGQRTYEDLARASSSVNEYEQLKVLEGSSKTYQNV